MRADISTTARVRLWRLFAITEEDAALGSIVTVKRDPEKPGELFWLECGTRGIVGHEFALFEQPDSMAMLSGEGEVVSNDNGEAALGGEFVEQGPEPRFVAGVEVRTWLVKKENLRLLADGSGEQNSLFLSAAQRRERAVAECDDACALQRLPGYGKIPIAFVEAAAVGSPAGEDNLFHGE
jgi:hypothetical protein